MNKLQYSIIYGVVRAEISERLSLGLIIVNGDKITVRYSQKKLSVMQALFSESEYKFVGKVLRSLAKNDVIKSVDAINYLSRYSNNLIAVSQLQTVDLKPTKSSQDWLYHNYIYAGA